MLTYYTAKRGTFSATPNDYYREQMQELINSQWDNTVTQSTIQEEYPFGSLTYRTITVDLLHALDKSTNKKQGNITPFLYSNMQELHVNCFELLKLFTLQRKVEINLIVNVAKAEKSKQMIIWLNPK